MLTQAEFNSILDSQPEGKKKAVKIFVSYKGGSKSERINYDVVFRGDVVTDEGHLVCLGPAGSTQATKKNRYVLRFKAVADKDLKRVGFENPDRLGEFDFIVGECVDGGCPEISLLGVNEEFESIAIEAGGELTLINRKINSDKNLGYRFKLWITHWSGEVHGIEIDPRIINK